MAIYDREYYRREGPSILGSIASTGQVCKWLIVANVVVYVMQVAAAPHGAFDDAGFLTRALSMNPVKAFQEFQIWRFLTAAFLHDPNNVFHLVWNMIFLWWLGTEMEDLYGSKEFLAFYLVAAVAGNAIWGLWTLLKPPTLLDHLMATQEAVGASGAVMAVLVLFTLHYPTRRILLFFILPVPMWLLTVIYVGKDLHAMLRGMDFGVAVACHVGGAAFGLLYWNYQWRLASILRPFQGGWRWTRSPSRGRPQLRIYREEVAAPVAAGPAERVDEQLEAKVDMVLEKLGRVGVENLTPEEQAILKRASEVYKKRRPG